MATNIYTHINGKHRHTNRLLALVLTLCCSALSLHAYDFEVDGIYYNVNTSDNTASVTYRVTSGSYSGTVNIPEEVEYEGTTYCVTSIGDFAFSGSSVLTAVTIPNSVTSIGIKAFDYCRGLTSITIPNSVTSISAQAFQDCRGLTSITIPNSVTSIGSQTFQDCSRLTEVSIADGTRILRFDTLSSIYHDVFSGCPIETLYLGRDISFYYSSPFRDNTSLKTLTIGDSVTNISSDAFRDNTSLKTLTIGNSVKYIYSNAFNGCSELTEVTIGNSVTYIGGYAFDGCSKLNKVIISDIAAWCGISYDHAYANPLYYAHHLYSDENTEITKLAITDSVTSIGSFAFYGCSGLTEVTIPNSVTSIGKSAFCECSGLTKVSIGNGVTSIKDYAFYGCSGLTNVNIADGIETLAFLKESSTSYINPFYNCPIETLYLGREISYSSNSPFQGNTSLKTLTIGSKVFKISNYAFNGCDSILSITVLKETPPTIDESTFSNTTYETAALHVPDESMIYYKMDQYWRHFYNIKEDALTGIDGVSADNEDDKQGEETVIYTLNGVRLSTANVSELPKGIYIVNGKKVAVK